MELGLHCLLDAPKRAISLRLRGITLAITTFFIALLVLPPIGVLLFSTFRSTQGRLPFEASSSFTLDNYIAVFTSSLTYRLIMNTLLYALGSIAISILLATIFAWCLERTRMPMRTFCFVLILTPMAIPAIVSTMGWSLLANPSNGLFNVILRSLFGLEGRGPLNIYSIPGMILVTGLLFVPVVYIMISGVFSRLDPSFEEASRVSGANTWTTFRKISLPLLAPALLAAAIYFAVLSMEVFEIPGLLGMPQGVYVFSTVIYYYLRLVTGLPDYGLASSYGMILLIVAGILIYFYSRYVRQTGNFATVTGRGYRPHLIELGKWKFVPIVLILLYFIFAVALPFLVLVWQSFAPRFTLPSLEALPLLSLDAYHRMLNYPQLWTVARNTLVFAAVTGVVVMILVTLSSWLSVRKVIRGASIPDRIAFLILAVPGVVVALAVTFLYVSLPVPIYGTLGIIIIAEVTVCLPFGTRMMGAAFLQIHKELEEASETSGADFLTTFTRVILPLLKPSVLRGYLWVFVRCIRETTLTLFLYGVANQTLAVTLWFLWTVDTDTPLASAIAIPMVIVSGILTYFVARGTMLQEQTV